MIPRSYLRIFRERWKLVVAIILLAVGIASVISALSPKTYQANVQVFVSANNISNNVINSQYDQNLAAQAQVATFASLIDTPEILKQVRSDLNLGLSDAQIAARLSADAPAAQTFVNVHVVDGNPDLAAAIANSASKAFIKVVENYKKPTDSTKSAVRLFVTDPATAPSTPISPKPLLNISLGMLLGLLVGAAAAVTRDILDNRIKGPEAFEKAAGKPAMGVVVEDSKTTRHPIATRAGTRSIRAENFRQLRANLQFANVDDHPRVIAITSSIPGEGKSMVAMNLASTLAEAGFTVCLVDADLRRPTIAKVMGLPGQVGLTSVLIHQVDLSEALQRAGSNLFVLSSGPTPPNPSEVLASSYVREIVRSLLERVDYVVIDTAPLLPVADGSEVAALADGTLLVARHNVTTEAQVQRATTSLAQVDARLIGVVLNRVPAKRSEYGYSYYQTDQPEGAHSRSGVGVQRRAPRRNKVTSDATNQ